jgi:hypothetical protein
MTATDPRPMFGSLGPDPGWMTTTAAAKVLGSTIRDLYRAIDRASCPPTGSTARSGSAATRSRASSENEKAGQACEAT